MANVVKDLGAVSAYALAVKHGYEGTESEWVAAQEAARVAAEAAAVAAKASQDAAKNSEEAATEAENNAKTSAEQAAASVQNAAAKATEAQTSANAAAQSAGKASGSQTAAAQSATEADASREAAAQSAQEAETSREAAQAVLDSIPEDYTQLTERVSTKAPAVYVDTSGGVVKVTDAAALPADQAVSTITAVQSGTGDPSPDNVRPIIGWDSAALTRTGKNLINIPEITTTRYGVDITASGNHIVMHGTSTAEVAGIATLHSQPIKAGSYMLSGTVMGSLSAIDGTSTVIVRASRDRGSTVDVVEVRLAHNSVSQIKLTVPYDGNVSIAVMLAKDSAVYDAYTIDVQLEAGDAATAIEPPAAQVTLSADLPETIYGGTLDWLTGELTVTHEGHVFDGTETWTLHNPETATAYFSYNVAPIGYVVNNSGGCSHYPSRTISSSNAVIGALIYNLAYGYAGIALRPDLNAIPDIDAWSAFLTEQYAAGTPMQVCYELAQPRTIQLTAQQLEMLKGCNTLWSDTGDTSVTYIADTKLYIDNKFTALQNAILAQGVNI